MCGVCVCVGCVPLEGFSSAVATQQERHWAMPGANPHLSIHLAVHFHSKRLECTPGPFLRRGSNRCNEGRDVWRWCPGGLGWQGSLVYAATSCGRNAPAHTHAHASIAMHQTIQMSKTKAAAVVRAHGQDAEACAKKHPHILTCMASLREVTSFNRRQHRNMHQIGERAPPGARTCLCLSQGCQSWTSLA